MYTNSEKQNKTIYTQDDSSKNDNVSSSNKKETDK